MMIDADLDALLENSLLAGGRLLVPREGDLVARVAGAWGATAHHRRQDVRSVRRWRWVGWWIAALMLSVGSLVAASSTWGCAALAPRVCVVVEGTLRRIVSQSPPTRGPLDGIFPEGNRALALGPRPPFRVLLPRALPPGWTLLSVTYFPGGHEGTVSDNVGRAAISGTTAANAPPDLAAIQATAELQASGTAYVWLEYGAPTGSPFVNVVEFASPAKGTAASGTGPAEGEPTARLLRSGTVLQISGASAGMVSAMAASLQ